MSTEIAASPRFSAASGLTLGLDLGPTSIGWALVDEAGSRLVAAGTRVFPEGVDRDQKGGEQSKNEQRRIARGMRRQVARRSRRKRLLRRALVAAGLLPETALLAPDDRRRVAWERDEFGQADPYFLRRRALVERLELYEFGRVLLHLNQHRGFFSNRKADRARKKETSDMLQEISALAADMGERTLGQYLAEMQAADPHARLRGRHTRRDMYDQEFEALWAAQQPHHPTVLTDLLKYGTASKQVYPREPEPLGDRAFLEKYGLHGVIFFQRPMYWPKSVVGQCELEPKLQRCPRADRLAQRVRLLQEVNNLRLLDSTSGQERPLRGDERTKLLAFLARSREKKFTDIRKHLGLLEGVRFNLERGERTKLLGMPTDAVLAHKGLFGKGWYDRPEQERDRIVRALLDSADDAGLLQQAMREWGLDEQTGQALLELDLGEGYASFSRVALEKLRPHLERGLPLMTRDGRPSALAEAGYLRPDQRVVNQKPFLPAPPEVTNPLVRQALHEVRKVVNAVIREFGLPARIHIELTREVKGNAEQRARRTQQMRVREQERDQAAAKIRELGIKVTREAIDRYLLWQEQHCLCIYSGRVISPGQLFGGEVDLDHILPRERSLDNSFMNRVVCFRVENEAKKDRTPHEWLAGADPEKYEAVLQRTKHADYPYAKARRFRQPSVELEDFFARQFVDTTYITTQVHEYVRCLGADVVCTKGMHTAELRRYWGLDSVLRDDGLHLKNREDHRHHAVDAIVIALTDRSRLQQLARLHRHGEPDATGEVLPEPWPHFRADVENAINAINVSHRVQRGVRGAYHEETIYGPTSKPRPDGPKERPWAKGWIEKPGEFVYRKPLEALTPAMIEDIRDPVIRQLVIDRLKAHNIAPGSAKKIPKEVWREPLRMASGVPVKKVRLIKRDLTILPIRQGTAHVKPGSIHHLCLFEYRDVTGKRKREAVFVSMLEAANRRKQRAPLIQRVHPTRPEAKFIMSLSRGELVLGTFKKSERLVCFNTAASTQGQIYFVAHTDARPSADREKFAVMAGTLKGRKVTVDVLGRIRWAND